MVRDILSLLNGSDLAVDRRDAALIALLFAAALRRSEIAGLDYGQVADVMYFVNHPGVDRRLYLFDPTSGGIILRSPAE